MDDQQARAAVLGWQRTVLAAHQGLLAGSATGQVPGNAGGSGGQWVADAAGLAGNAVNAVVDGAASVGNAVINNPLAALAVPVGGAVTALGAGLEVGGVALDATGVGALVGVPANVAGAGVMAFGGTMAAAGVADLAQAASGADKVGPMQVDWKTKKGEPAKTIAATEAYREASAAAHDKLMSTGKIPKGKDKPPPLQPGKN